MLSGFAASNGPLVVAAEGYQFRYHAGGANFGLLGGLATVAIPWP